MNRNSIVTPYIAEKPLFSRVHNYPRDNSPEFSLEISRTIIQMQEYGLRRLSCGVFILTFQVIRGIINATYYGGDIMCDVKKYEKIYEDIQKLQPEDTLQLVLEAETEEQRNFYEMVGDFLLQKKQRQVIERNLF